MHLISFPLLYVISIYSPHYGYDHTKKRGWVDDGGNDAMGGVAGDGMSEREETTWTHGGGG